MRARKARGKRQLVRLAKIIGPARKHRDSRLEFMCNEAALRLTLAALATSQH
jgi:hypothetical protein